MNRQWQTSKRGRPSNHENTVRTPAAQDDIYPEAYVRALRETTERQSECISRSSVEDKFASVGVGLGAYGRMQLYPLSSFDMYDLDYFPSAGQAALKEVHNAQTMRAKERTMDELKSILGRIDFTFENLRDTTENTGVVSLTPDVQEQREKEEKMKRRERIKRKILKMRRKVKEKEKKEECLKKIEVNKKVEKTETRKETEMQGNKKDEIKERETGIGMQESKKDEKIKTVEEKHNEDTQSQNTEIPVEQQDDEDDEDDSISMSSGELDEYDSTDFSDISSDEMEEEEVQRKSSLTELAERRRRTSEAITCYFDRCVERDDLMRQMQTWMETTTTQELDAIPAVFKSEHKMILSPDLLDDSKTADIELAIGAFKETMIKLKDIADGLGIGKTEQEEVEEIQPAEKKKLAGGLQKQKMAAKVYTDDELLKPDNFDAAISSMVKILEDAVKSTPARLLRLSLTNGLKQFKYICKIMEHRESKLTAYDKEILKLGGDLAKNKKVVEDLRKNKKKILVKCEKFEYLVEDQKTKLITQKKQVDELTKLVEDYKKKESYGLYDQSSISSSLSSASLSSSEEESKVEKKKEKKGKGKKKKKAKGKSKTKKSKQKEQQIEEKEQSSSDKAASDQEQLEGDEQSVKKTVDIESTDVYLELKIQFEHACDKAEIEREKLAEIEKEFENVKNEKVVVEQEKSDLVIEIDNLKRQQEVETEELRDQIANFELETRKLRGEIECNEEMIQYQEERINQCTEDFQNLEERLLSSLPNTPAMSSASVAKVTRRSMTRKTSLAMEQPTARQMVAKIRQQYEVEIQGLKDYLAKENQRYLAESRRKEQEHKKDIQNIHKESLQVLRSINRFKECASNLLDRENLPGEAHTLRRLPPLPLDDTPGEIRMMLARMAILSNELLVSIELQLSKALMNKRLEVKGTAQSRVLVKKDLDAQSQVLRRTKDFASNHASKFRNAREELKDQEAEFMTFKLHEGEKQEVLEERYSELLNAFTALKREGVGARKVEKTEKEKEEKLERKEIIIKKFMRKEKSLNRALEEQRKVITNLTTAWRSRRFGQLYISREDQLDNLGTLKEALLKDRIPKGLYEMTSNLIQEAIDLPRKRFVDLVQKYVRYVNMKEMELRARRMKIEEDLGDSAMKFIHMLEKRIEMQQELWKKKKEAFVKHRAETLMNLSKVLTRINEETTILVTLPKILMRRTGQEEGESADIPDLYETVKLLQEREKMKTLAADMKHTTDQMGEGPSPPLAVRVNHSGMGPLWKMKGMPHQAHVTTPRILDLDVNMTRLAAHAIVSQVSKGPWDQLSKSLPQLMTFKPRTFMQKSISQPSSKGIRSFQSKRTLTLPPIAGFYSSDDFTNVQKEQS